MTGNPLRNMAQSAIKTGPGLRQQHPTLDRNQCYLGDDPLPSHNARTDSVQEERPVNLPGKPIGDLAKRLVMSATHARVPVKTDD